MRMRIPASRVIISAVLNVLVLSSRFPWPAYTGDRLRAAIWLAALQREAEVALVSPDGTVPRDAPRFRFHPAPVSPLRGIARALRVAAGAPMHSLLAAPYDWKSAIDDARRETGTFDATVVLLSRLDVWVGDSLPDGLHVLDAIDSLRRSMEERSKESSSMTRALWRMESRRVGRAERDAAKRYDRVVVVSEEDTAELGAVAISNGVAIAPLSDEGLSVVGSRLSTTDFAFWGRLAYFANADAASWLIREIWPAIRALRPESTLLIAGADAPASIRAAHGRDGIVVQSPVDDIAALTRSVKVALFPVRYGTGQSNKVLEAAEGGCAIVATAHAMRGLQPLAPHAFLGDDAAALARSAVAAVSDESRRASMANAARRTVETHYSRQETLERLAAIVRPAGAAL
jgi:glycosyltransferase involved in cell wall biosynthesis